MISAGGPVVTTSPSHHDNQVVGIPSRLIEIVQHRDDSLAVLVERPQEFHQLVLMGDVEEGGRLVEQHDRRLLGQQHGDPDPLALTAGQLVHQ